MKMEPINYVPELFAMPDDWLNACMCVIYKRDEEEEWDNVLSAIST